MDDMKSRMMQEWMIEVRKIKWELKQMPSGRLAKYDVSGKTYYLVDSSENGVRKRRGITKDKLQIARYARKTYLELLAKHMEQTTNWTNAVVPWYFQPGWGACLDEAAKRFPGIPKEVFLTGKPAGAPAQSMNPMKPGSNIHITPRGIQVKSKSELAIATALEQKDIPYEYEKALAVEGAILYPDFTILRPRDKKVFYWEHFGMTHLPEYLERMDRKLHTYRTYGIVPWDNLIQSYDTQKGSLDLKRVMGMVEGWLL